MTTTFYRLEFSAQQQLFHFADLHEPGKEHFGWKVISPKIPENIAWNFTEYAFTHLLKDDQCCTSRMIKECLDKWLAALN